MRRIEIKDFSKYPAGRHREDGDATGEKFRDDILYPALQNGPVELILDGVAGLPSSFLEEVMGGLIRHGLSIETIKDRLVITAVTPRMLSYPEQAWRYIRDAASARSPA